jgi:hypothetical protein
LGSLNVKTKIIIIIITIIIIQRMWNVKTKVISVITGANGTISKTFRKYVKNIPGNHEVKELRKQPYWALRTYFGKY